MNQTRQELPSTWNHIQSTLFPWLQEELGELTEKQQQLVEVLELAQIETHIPYMGRRPGRPLESRSAIARAFVAKAVYNMPTTEVYEITWSQTSRCADSVGGRRSVTFPAHRPSPGLLQNLPIAS